MRDLSLTVLSRIIKTATGEERADIWLKDVRLVNVFSSEVYQTNVSLKGAFIANIGNEPRQANQVFDLKGKYLLPGLINAHIHLESSLAVPSQFARGVTPSGTTTVIIDPHEIANVLGMKGISYILSASQQIPLNLFVMVPSSVPTTEMETAGSIISSREVKEALKLKRVLGLAEVMNFPSVISCSPEILQKILLTKRANKIIDGHAPGLSGVNLNAYLSAGISSDHECTTLNEAREKLRLGMYIMIREGSAARNLRDLISLVNDSNYRRCIFVTDDRNPKDMLEEGDMNNILKQAVRLGLDPIKAVSMATLNPAEYFGLKGLGGIAPGYLADLLVVEDLKGFKPLLVFKDGRLVAEQGQMVVPVPEFHDPQVCNTIKVKPLSREDLLIRVKPDTASTVKAKVIQLIPDQIVTKRLILEIGVKEGIVGADPQTDILKLVVVERHRGSGQIGLGLVKGFGLKQGCIASSVAHDSHNIIACGVEDEDILAAIQEIIKMGGGYTVVSQRKVIACLPLPVAGLMSQQPIEETRQRLLELDKVCAQLGTNLREPFITLSFLALPVIPELKLTDKGLFDAVEFKLVSLF